MTSSYLLLTLFIGLQLVLFLNCITQSFGETTTWRCSGSKGKWRRPHQTDCKKYLQCLVRYPNKYFMKEMACRGKSVFDDKLLVCALPEFVNPLSRCYLDPKPPSIERSNEARNIKLLNENEVEKGQKWEWKPIEPFVFLHLKNLTIASLNGSSYSASILDNNYSKYSNCMHPQTKSKQGIGCKNNMVMEKQLILQNPTLLKSNLTATTNKPSTTTEPVKNSGNDLELPTSWPYSTTQRPQGLFTKSNTRFPVFLTTTEISRRSSRIRYMFTKSSVLSKEQTLLVSISTENPSQAMFSSRTSGGVETIVGKPLKPLKDGFPEISTSTTKFGLAVSATMSTAKGNSSVLQLVHNSLPTQITTLRPRFSKTTEAEQITSQQLPSPSHAQMMNHMGQTTEKYTIITPTITTMQDLTTTTDTSKKMSIQRDNSTVIFPTPNSGSMKGDPNYNATNSRENQLRSNTIFPNTDINNVRGSVPTAKSTNNSTTNSSSELRISSRIGNSNRTDFRFDISSVSENTKEIPSQNASNSSKLKQDALLNNKDFDTSKSSLDPTPTENVQTNPLVNLITGAERLAIVKPVPSLLLVSTKQTPTTASLFFPATDATTTRPILRMPTTLRTKKISTVLSQGKSLPLSTSLHSNSTNQNLRSSMRKSGPTALNSSDSEQTSSVGKNKVMLKKIHKSKHPSAKSSARSLVMDDSSENSSDANQDKPGYNTSNSKTKKIDKQQKKMSVSLAGKKILEYKIDDKEVSEKLLGEEAPDLGLKDSDLTLGMSSIDLL